MPNRPSTVPWRGPSAGISSPTRVSACCCPEASTRRCWPRSPIGRPGHTPEFITIGFEGIPSPDVEFARAVASHLHGTHTVLTLSGRDLSHQVPAAIAAMDQPTVDGINTFVVSSAASSAGVRVLLSGLGGDELFGGYTTFRRAPLLARFGGFAAAVAPVLTVLDRKRRRQWSKVASARRITACRDAYLLQRAIHWGRAHPAMPAVDGPPDDVQMPPETWQRLGAAAGVGRLPPGRLSGTVVLHAKPAVA